MFFISATHPIMCSGYNPFRFWSIYKNLRAFNAMCDRYLMMIQWYSVYEDIINILAGLDWLDNAIGNPELQFASDYPALRNLREV